MSSVSESKNPSGRDSQLSTSTATIPTPVDSGVEPTVGEPILLFDKVSKWYGPVLGVNRVTLELREGITGLVGANGAGKSTLMKLATGQIAPDTGSVTLRGNNARSNTARRLVGYSPDLDSLYEEMSGYQFLWTMGRLCGFSTRETKLRVEQALEQVGMLDRSTRRLKGYSKGMRQRIKIAQGLLHGPELLILDEPLSGIDPVGRQELIDLFMQLANQGKCLLISSHELEELEKLTDHVVIMANGRIAAVGTISQIRSRLHDQPVTIRVDVQEENESTNTSTRKLASALMESSEVVGVNVMDDPFDTTKGRLLVRATNGENVLRSLSQLVIEEWFELTHLEIVDESTSAVLGYLLRGST